MKVIAKDNYNRDYQPERLITVSIDNATANIIADKLNEASNGETYYDIVPDDYQLNLESMYDVTDISIPNAFYIEQLGLKALESEPNLKLNVIN